MSGANDAHVTIVGNLLTLICKHVRGLGCRIYMSDMKVRIESINRFYYPDVIVTCDDLEEIRVAVRDRSSPTYKQFPCLIVEVLSDSTEAFDRGDKFADYQQLESLQEYVLINTKRQRVECFRCSDRQRWILEIYTPETNSFELKAIDFQGTLETLYEDVTF